MESICLTLRISLCWVGLSSNSWDNKGWDSSKAWFSQTLGSFGGSAPAPLNKYCCLPGRLGARAFVFRFFPFSFYSLTVKRGALWEPSL